MKSLSFALAAVALVSSCAFTPQSVVISPTINVVPSGVGADRAVGLTVVDERPRQALGTRGMSGVGAEITVAGDVRAIVEKALLQGLTMQSFRPAVGSSSERELRVEIRTLNYAVIQEFWAGKLNVDVGLKAICIRGPQRPYEQLHRGHFTESVQVVQGQGANNSYISQAVSAAVNSLLQDEKLLACLGGE